MHEKGCVELFLCVSIRHSTSNGNPFAPHLNDTLSPISMETLISSLGLSNHGETRGRTNKHSIDLFIVVCLVTWPLNEKEAVGDLVMIETSLLLLCKFLLISISTASLT